MSEESRYLEMLKSPKASVRYEACELLRVQPSLSPDALSALELALEDPDRSVRDSAGSALKVHKPNPMPPQSATQESKETVSEERTTQNINTTVEPEPIGCSGQLIWLLKGFYQPLYKLDFYRRALNKRVLTAIVFFVLFGIVLTFISTLRLYYSVMSTIPRNIRDAYEEGRVPEIVIEDGIASVSGDQPYVLENSQGTFTALDTTGKYQRIDSSRYAQGLLLTRDELHILTTTRYQIMKLSDLQRILGANPLVLDQEGAVKISQRAIGLLSILIFIMYGFWNSIAWLIFMCFLALIMLGIARIIGSRAEFNHVLILGIYAFVPVVYLTLLLDLINFRFSLLRILLLLSVWTFLVYRLSAEKIPPALPDQPDKS